MGSVNTHSDMKQAPSPTLACTLDYPADMQPGSSCHQDQAPAVTAGLRPLGPGPGPQGRPHRRAYPAPFGPPCPVCKTKSGPLGCWPCRRAIGRRRKQVARLAAGGGGARALTSTAHVHMHMCMCIYICACHAHAHFHFPYHTTAAGRGMRMPFAKTQASRGPPAALGLAIPVYSAVTGIGMAYPCTWI